MSCAFCHHVKVTELLHPSFVLCENPGKSFHSDNTSFHPDIPSEQKATDEESRQGEWDDAFGTVSTESTE